MEKLKYNLLLTLTITAIILTSCSDNLFKSDEPHDSNRILLSGDIDQLAVTRVNDNGFCNGDQMGVYIVDYEGDYPGTLKVSGNRGDNVCHTFDEKNYKWNSAYDLYWKDKHTHIDVYGYYPYATPESIDNYSFEVKKDQSKESADGEMGGYEASDFLWGKVADVAPTTNVVRLPLSHRMSNAKVTLVKGSGFTDEEWTNTEKVVLTTNVARKASINLSNGEVTVAGGVESTATIPSHTGNEWRTIVIPQTIPAGTTLFSITIGGIPYKFTKSEAMTYMAGKMMNFSIKVDKNTASGEYKLTLINESITPWENDHVSHNATAKEYVVINSTAGHLKEAIAKANKDYSQLKNLKLTGEINKTDFEFMNKEMTKLESLNLKEVRITALYQSGTNYAADEIPSNAFYSKGLVHLILPDRLKAINDFAFACCKSLVGSLIIPEGVERLDGGTFYDCTGLDGTLSLPSTLKSIGASFDGCSSLTGNLILPEGLESLGSEAFMDCRGFYGELHLPSSLTKIGANAFYFCTGLTGSLNLPSGIKEVGNRSFVGCGFDGTLTLPDGIEKIDEFAFSGCHFKGNLILPKNLKLIGQHAFSDNNFSGELTFPSSLTTIGEGTFCNNARLSGTLEFTENITNIQKDVFAGCQGINKIIFSSSIENIGEGAFTNCFGISSIISKGETPAHVGTSTFAGVAKDNFTLEVPEPSISQYQTASGWRDFKRIAAHHELYCRPSIACALNTEHRQTLVIDAEGEWEVASKPDWCEVSPANGNKKTEVTLTIKSMAKGTANRDGKVVFRLKDKDYTHTCDVSQYDYEHGEDEWITLQKATRGNNGGINIVFLGDGYNAKDIASGNYLKNVKQEMEDFFDIEPYKTYRNYFNVYAAMPLSTESGIGTINTIRDNRFGTTFTGGVGLKADYEEIFAYALGAPTVNKNNLNQTLIIIVPNSTEYGGVTQMWEDGSAISFCPLSTYTYPLDSRGVIQHEAGGHGFGKLGDEYIYHNTFIDVCNCTCCGHVDAFNWAKSLGWYDNLSLTGKMHSVTWSHLIFDDRYSDIVDIYEGGFKHNRGVFRSEPNSCMNNDIPYYSTISRESIVKRIKQYAGEDFSFEDFVKNDKREASIVESRAFGTNGDERTAGLYQHSPVFHKASPLKMKKVRIHR